MLHTVPIPYTAGTNSILLESTLSPQEIEYYSDQIKKIPFVIFIRYYSNYITELEEAKKMHDYFKVFAYSSTILEHYGKQLIVKHFKEKFGPDKIKNLTFQCIEIILYSNGIIKKSLYDDMDDIRQKRNKFIHLSIKKDSISYDKIKEMETLATKCVNSVSRIITIYDEK